MRRAVGLPSADPLSYACLFAQTGRITGFINTEHGAQVLVVRAAITLFKADVHSLADETQGAQNLPQCDFRASRHSPLTNISTHGRMAFCEFEKSGV